MIFILFLHYSFGEDDEAWFFHRGSSGFVGYNRESNKMNVAVMALPTKIILRCHVLERETPAIEINKNRLLITATSQISKMGINHINQSRTIQFPTLNRLREYQIESNHNTRKNQFEIYITFPYHHDFVPIEIL